MAKCFGIGKGGEGCDADATVLVSLGAATVLDCEDCAARFLLEAVNKRWLSVGSPIAITPLSLVPPEEIATIASEAVYV